MLVRFTGILVMATLAGHMAFAAPCVKPADVAAFNVTGLKSRLMVTALSCHAGEKYAAFTARFRPGLLKRERQLNAYFTRVHGRSGEREREAYITALANAQSLLAAVQGPAFCARGLALFRQAMALRRNASLAKYAARSGLIQPIALIACSGPGHAIRTAGADAPSRGF